MGRISRTIICLTDLDHYVHWDFFGCVRLREPKGSQNTFENRSLVVTDNLHKISIIATHRAMSFLQVKLAYWVICLVCGKVPYNCSAFSLSSFVMATVSRTWSFWSLLRTYNLGISVGESRNIVREASFLNQPTISMSYSSSSQKKTKRF